MKKLLLILIILFPCFVFAQGMNPVGGITFTPAAGGGECTGYLICQNLEGTGTDNSETWTGVAGDGAYNPDYTTTALRGSQSLLLTCSTCDTVVTYTSPTFAETSPVHIAFRFRLIANPTDNADIIYLRNATTTLIYGTLRDTGHVNIINGAGDADDLGTAAGTTYYIWIDYTKGTGANAVMDTYVATSRTKPAIHAHTTNGDGTLGATNIQFLNRYAASGYIIDQVLISSSAIGDMPL